jgi:protein-S-isoprenylcysteine O-methyltransferase Ste14
MRRQEKPDLVEDQDKREAIDRRRLVLSICGTLLCLAVALFLPAGSLLWIRGWIFLVMLFVYSVFATIYLWRTNPEVITARINRHQGTKPWDRIIVPSLLFGGLTVLVVAGLDDGRFHWSQLPIWVCVLGYVLLAPGMVVGAWAELVNKFFEPTVRIQTDRGHRVVDTGPYAFVRHPGYVSAIPFFLGTPLALGSLWGLIPAVVTCLLLLVRTVWEDQTLRDELPGYKEYSERVRFRWIPGLW